MGEDQQIQLEWLLFETLGEARSPLYMVRDVGDDLVTYVLTKYGTDTRKITKMGDTQVNGVRTPGLRELWNATYV